MSRKHISSALLLGMFVSACAFQGEEELNREQLNGEERPDDHRLSQGAHDRDRQQLAVESCDVRHHSMDVDLDLESLLHIVVPVANVESYVPAPFEIVRLPGAAAGEDGALLWLLIGDINSIVTDGVEHGPVLAAHAFLLIEEPEAPSGFPNRVGAAHLYEIEFILNDQTLVNWLTKNLGGSTSASHRMDLTRTAPGLLTPGTMYMEVGGDPKVGNFTYYVEHADLLPSPGPVVHAWWRGSEGLVRWDPDMTGGITPVLDNEVCAGEGSWLREIFGTECRSGTGVVISLQVESTYNVWPCL